MDKFETQKDEDNTSNSSESESSISVEDDKVKRSKKRRINASSLKVFGNWLTKTINSTGDYELYCKICNTNLKGSGGKNDFIKHQNTKKHKEKANCIGHNQTTIENEFGKNSEEIEDDTVEKTKIGRINSSSLKVFGNWLTKIKNSTGDYELYCKICKAYLKGTRSKSDLIQHQSTKRHKEKAKCIGRNQTITENGFRKNSDEISYKIETKKKPLSKMKSGLNEKWLVCRICLKQPKEEMQTIFDKNAEKDLTRMILECGGVPIKQFDHYPDKICSKCYKYLQVAYKFRLTCQRSHNHLSKFIAPVEVDKRNNDNDMDDETNFIGNAMPMTEEGYVLDENNDEFMVKVEHDSTNTALKEEYTVHIQEEDDDFVEIYEPMTEEEEKEVFQLADDTFDNDSVNDSQDNAEYLELEDDLELPSSDEEFIPQAQSKAKAKVLKRQTAHASTSRKAAAATTKRVKREPKEKKPKDTSYICDFCGNKYPSQGRLTEHIKLHKGIKPHECEICGHCFAQGQQLARHMNTHTGNRPYKCSYCPAAFADLSTRNKHHRIHTNERPYVCDVCGKSFTYTNTLKFHKMIHTGEKPFVCDICGKGFPQNYKLRNHRMIHEKKGIKLEMVEVTKIENSQEQQAVYHHDAHVEAAAQQLLEI